MVALKAVAAAAAICAVAVAGVVYLEFDNLVPIVGLGINYVRFLDAPTYAFRSNVSEGFSPKSWR